MPLRLPDRHQRTRRRVASGGRLSCQRCLHRQAGLRAGIRKSEERRLNGSVPVFEVDPFWPKPLPEDWILGQCSGVAVDENDHVWMCHRPLTLTAREAGKVQDPPLADCCTPAPSIIEFDPEGNVVNAFGGQGGPDRWPQSEHGMYVDPMGSVWMASNCREDHVVLKFEKSGNLLLTVGEWGVTGGSNDTKHLGAPTDVTVDPTTNEAYVSDGYRNRRIIVFDATTGEYRRHWGAYGERPEDEELQPYQPGETPIRHFRSPIHSVRIGVDGLVYTADRVNNRIQVFEKSGQFVREAFLGTWTRAMGAVWDIDFSPDPNQTFIFVPDGTNMKVWILTREDLKVVATFGRGGRQAGQFEWVHNLACDSRGNLYTTEVSTGKRIQKFVLKS